MKTILLYSLLLIFGCTCNSSKNISADNKTDTDTFYTYKNASYDGIGKYYLGREIAHVMGAGVSDWLEREERNEEENAELAIAKMPLSSNSVVADLGAGTGYYSFRIAERIPQGKLYAIDIQDEMLRQLQQRKKLLKDSVVEVIKGTEQSINLPASSTDLLIMVDVYHELSYPREILQSAYKALKPSGKILLLEYRKEDPSIPIKELHKMSVEQINKEMAANGFTLSSRKEFLPIQHFLLYEKAK